MTKRRQTSDGRVMTEPELRINEGSLSPDTIFTVRGTSPWGSTSEYNVVLNGPNSYYTYKAAQLETDKNGDEVRSWGTKTGNDPNRLARYRQYVKEGEQANDYTSAWEDFLHYIGLRKNGGWLGKFQGGGFVQQSTSPEQDVMNTIDAAIGELQTKRLGQAVQKLAAMMQDPNYSMIIDMMKQKYPQIEGVLNTVEQMVGAYKCGGKTKKKVKKGAKGCVPCKKLMRVGGKLINVWTDCEGNIISKHQVGGWVRKGSTGFNTAVLNEAYTKAATNAPESGKTGEVHYYQDTDGSWKKQIWSSDGGESPLAGSWSDGQALTDADQAAFVQWRDKNAGNIFKTGFTANWNNYSGTFDTEDNAVAAIGRETFDQGAFTGKTVRGVTGKSGNTWLGADTSSPTAKDYIDQYGFQGALNNEGRLRRSRLLEAKQDRRAASRAALKNGLVGQGQLRAINQEWRDSRDEIKSQHKAQTAALINAYTGRSHSTVGTPNLTTGSMTHTSASTAQAAPAKKEEYTIMQKQGGWLTKFN